MILFLWLLIPVLGNNVIVKYVELIKTAKGINVFPIREILKIPHKNESVPKNEVLNHAKNLKSLDVIKTPDKKKYLILKDLPILCVYIPWRYGRTMDPTAIQMMEYFIKIALKRSYNKFIIQMISVDDEVKNKIALNNINVLFNMVESLIKNLMENVSDDSMVSMINNYILIKGEIVNESEVKDITNIHGGFFLLATKVQNDHAVRME